MISALRRLARSYKYRSKFILSKDLPQIKFLDNMDDLSELQFRFLEYVRLYCNLYEELYTRDCPLLSEEVIKSDFLCDAYLAYKAHEVEQAKLDGKFRDLLNGTRKSEVDEDRIHKFEFLTPPKGGIKYGD
jgi:hypothetical protein